jgi:hypothetical protein
MAVLLDLITDSWAKIGQLGIGQSLSPEQAQQGFRESNRMVGNWSVRRLMLYTINKRPFVLTGGVQDYTVGPTGGFAQPRPTFVEGAQAIIPGTLNEVPMNLLDVVKWGAIRDKGATCSALGTPSDIWPEYSYPNMGFHVWPIPAIAVNINLRTWEQLQQFATVFDVFTFPVGYEEPFTDNLAIRLAPYSEKPIPPDLAQSAAQGLIDIQAINAQSIGGAIGDSRLLQAPNLDRPIPSGGPPQGA